MDYGLIFFVICMYLHGCALLLCLLTLWNVGFGCLELVVLILIINQTIVKCEVLLFYFILFIKGIKYKIKSIYYIVSHIL